MMKIETERLIIRRFIPDDWRDLAEYLADPEVVKFEPCEPLSEEQCKKEAARRSADPDFLAVVCRENEKLIGNLYFSPRDFDTWELGFVFHRGYWRQGYASESASALIRHAFRETSCRRVVAGCDPCNPASWKLLERLGMRREGTRFATHFFKRNPDGSPLWADTYEYAVLRNELCFPLETARLRILPLDRRQMKLLLDGTPQLETALGLNPSGRELDAHTHAAMCGLRDLAQKTPCAYPWMTNWQIILKEKNISIGSVCFMNVPNEAGEVEVGYGIYPDFQNQGFMSEALRAVCDWALQTPNVKFILAESEPENAASHRVLEKCGFNPVSATHWRVCC